MIIIDSKIKLCFGGKRSVFTYLLSVVIILSTAVHPWLTRKQKENTPDSSHHAQ